MSVALVLVAHSAVGLRRLLLVFAGAVLLLLPLVTVAADPNPFKPISDEPTPARVPTPARQLEQIIDEEPPSEDDEHRETIDADEEANTDADDTDAELADSPPQQLERLEPIRDLQHDPESTPPETDEPGEALSRLPERKGKMKSLENPLTVESPQGVRYEPAAIDRVRPGSTTRVELRRRWGDPLKVEKHLPRYRETYQSENIGTIQVILNDDTVESLVVRLPRPLSAEKVAKQLEISTIEPVDVFDEFGGMLGRAYPEAGVLLGFLPDQDAPMVFQVAIDGIDPQAFLERAESRLANQWRQALADLQVAIELDPKSGKGHALFAELARRAGELDRAREAAEKALSLEPGDEDYKLALAQVMADQGEYNRAARFARELAESKSTGPLVAAKANWLWGEVLSGGPDPDYPQALKLHQKAVSLAQPLAKSTKWRERRAAKELLVDAHLAIAHDIGWGRWQQKSTAVPKWLEKAETLAEDLIDREQGSPELKLHVSQRALVAISGIAGPPDASSWIRKLQQEGEAAIERASDETYRAQLSWRLGASLAAAVEIEAARKRLDKALAYGQKALEYFEQGESVAAGIPTSDLVRGRLCYRMGAIWAIEREDHAKAIEWYERAIPLLESATPACAMSDTGRQGEIFVSIGVSYWETKNQPEALRLTEQGVSLMEHAAEEGKLTKTALAIPYGNLSSMHEKLGHTRQAKQYSERAARWEEAQ